MSLSEQPLEPQTPERAIIALFDGPRPVQAALDMLWREDHPMDRVSVLGPAGSGGDDPLGIYYRTREERMRGWGKMGAFWGGIWGLVAGAAGLFVVPGVGALAAAGPLVEALAGAAAGAVAAGGAMAGAAAVSQLAVALRSAGIPEQKLDALHRAIAQGHYLLMLRCPRQECPPWRSRLAAQHPEALFDFPVRSLWHAS